MEEIKKTLSLEVKGQKTIADLKQEVSALKKELEGCAVGSEEAKEKSQELAQAQTQLTAAMKGAVDETGELDNSYNGLVAQMALLKAEQKATCDLMTTEGKKAWADYAKRINDINDKLKAADASNGVFSRNVGNYAGSIAQAFSGLGGSVGGLVTGINSAKTAMMGLQAAGGWIGAVVAIIAAIVKAIQSSDSALDSVKESLAPLKGVANAMMVIVQEIGKALAVVIEKVMEGVTWLLDKIPGLNKYMDDAKAIAIEENKLEERRVEITKQNAASKAEIVKLENRFRMAAGNTNKQLEIAKQIDKERQRMLNNNYELAKREYELIVKKNEQNESTDEDLQRQAEAYERMVTAQAQLVTNSSEMQKVWKTMSTTQQQAYLTTELQKQTNILKEQQQLVKEEGGNVAYYRNQAKIWENMLKGNMAEQQRTYAEGMKATAEAMAKASEEALKNAKENVQSTSGLVETMTTDLKDVEDALKKERQKTYSDNRKELIEDVKKEGEGLIDYIVSYFPEYGQKHIEDLTNAQLRNILNNIENVIKEDGRRRLQRNPLLLPVEVKVEAMPVEEEDDSIESVIKGVENRIKSIEEAKKTYLFLKHQDAFESIDAEYEFEMHALEMFYKDKLDKEEEYQRLRAEIEAKYAKKRKDATAQEISNYTQVANGIADIMSSVASSWEDSIRRQVEAGEISEEEGEKQFERVKAMQIATATIQTITGAITAFMTAQELGFPWGTIIGAINAAAVTAAGIAEIAKIKSTTLGGGGSVGGGAAAGFTLPALEQYTPDYTQNMTGASDMQDLSGTITSALEQASIKAYVVESDVTDAQNKAKRRNQESTW